MRKTFNFSFFVVSFLTCFISISPLRGQNIDKIDASKLKDGKYTFGDRPVNGLILTAKIKDGAILAIKAKRKSTGKTVKITKIAPNDQSCIGPNEFCLTFQRVFCYTWGGVCFCSCGGFIYYPHSSTN